MGEDVREKNERATKQSPSVEETVVVQPLNSSLLQKVRLLTEGVEIVFGNETIFPIC